MFVYFDKSKQQKPVKIWLEDISQVDDGCLQQVTNLSNLPFIYKWPALMPDCHEGYGMPIGGVIATDGVIIPNAVGVDIGCGICYVQTDVSAEIMQIDSAGQGKLIQAIIGQILRTVPTGFDHHKKKRQCTVLERALDQFPREHLVKKLVPELDSGFYQVGTLGGGNHFIEIQEDEDGLAGLMVHSGSRNFGYKICNYFNKVAKELNARWKSAVPASYDLAYLPVDSEEGQQYISWMQLAQDFAKENRSQIMEQVLEIFCDYLSSYGHLQDIKFDEPINCHHNYASFEEHYNKEVWVHRKGAISAKNREMGVIPGAMGSYSYIVEGLGNPESFHSCSHGAGRVYSRKKAKQTFSVQQVMEDLKQLGVALGKRKKGDVAEECRMVYKDIDFVLSQQMDLVRPVKKLKTLGVVKG